MKNLVIRKKVRLMLVLVSFMVVSFSNVIAGEYELLESKTNTLTTPTNLDFVIDYISLESDEEPLEIQEWMLNPEEFEDNLINELTWDESFMDIEPWMLDVDTFVEEDLDIEAWMTDVNSFLEINEPELALEEWMVDVDAFLNTSSSTYAFK